MKLMVGSQADELLRRDDRKSEIESLGGRYLPTGVASGGCCCRETGSNTAKNRM